MIRVILYPFFWGSKFQGLSLLIFLNSLIQEKTGMKIKIDNTDIDSWH